MLKDKRFWIGFIVGYLLLAVMPSFNVLAKMGKGKSGG